MRAPRLLPIAWRRQVRRVASPADGPQAPKSQARVESLPGFEPGRVGAARLGDPVGAQGARDRGAVRGDAQRVRALRRPWRRVSVLGVPTAREDVRSWRARAALAHARLGRARRRPSRDRGRSRARGGRAGRASARDRKSGVELQATLHQLDRRDGHDAADARDRARARRGRSVRPRSERARREPLSARAAKALPRRPRARRCGLQRGQGSRAQTRPAHGLAARD
jgi:hypothetical protein